MIVIHIEPMILKRVKVNHDNDEDNQTSVSVKVPFKTRQSIVNHSKFLKSN